MRRVALVGDSVFDNEKYLDPGEPSVADQLRDRLAPEDAVDCPAVDGHCLSDVPEQLEQLSDATTHLFLSAGGTDALGFLTRLGHFQEPTNSLGEGVDSMGRMRESFMLRYRKLLEGVVDGDFKTILCTLYAGNFPDRTLQSRIETVLPIVNDVIVGAACDYGLPLIELRQVFVEEEDYASTLEPSAHGSDKLARAMVRVLDEHDFSTERTTIYSDARERKLCF